MTKRKRWYQYTWGKSLILIFVVFVLLFSTLRMEKIELYLPGGVEEIDAIVKINGESQSNGKYYSSYVTTITKPTPIIYLFAKNFMDAEVVKLSKSTQKLSDKELRNISRISKIRSIDAAIIAAYHAANKPIEYREEGIWITAVDPLAQSYHHLEIGDVITHINGQPLRNAEEFLTQYLSLSCKSAVNLTVLRNQKSVDLTVPLTPREGGCYLGISYTTYLRIISATPEYTIMNNEGLGGSAGLLQALMIYDKLIEHDITQGKKISGTGGIEIDGKVTGIAGIRQKVLGAIKDGVDIFFVPKFSEDDETDENSLVYIAKKTVAEKNSKMIIKPVSTLPEAIEFLESLMED